MRVVVTGASGNVGSALLRRLHREPEVTEVVGICRHPPAAGTGPLHEGVRWVAADVSSDELAPHFAGADAVVHLAWVIQPSHKPGVLDAINVTGSRRVMRAGTEAGVNNFVVASSLAVYAPGRGQRADESWPTTGVPDSLYSAQKVALERTLDEFESEHPQARVVRVRPAAIFQRQAASEIVRHFLGPFVPRRLIRRSLLPVLPLPQGFTVQDIHSDDVAEAYTLALTSDVRGAFNVAAEPVLDGPTLARLLHARLVPVSFNVLSGAFRRAWRLQLHPTDPSWLDLLNAVPELDTSRARRELGWAPTRDAGDTLLELLDGIAHRATGPTPTLAEAHSPVP